MNRIRFLLFFVCLLFFSDAYCNRARQLVLLGDGTVANDVNIETSSKYGWGQVLPTYLKDNIVVQNYSSDLASTRNVLNDGIWAKVLTTLRYNDFLVIQLGHNDMDIEDTLMYSSINDYESNLKKIVSEALDKRVRTILVTPVPRYSFSEKAYYNSHGAYPQAVRRVAEFMQVPLIDLDKMILFDEDFKTTFATYFVEEKDKVLSKQPANVRVYFNEHGALEVARYVAQSMRKIPHIRRFVSPNDTVVPNIVYALPASLQ